MRGVQPVSARYWRSFNSSALRSLRWASTRSRSARTVGTARAPMVMRIVRPVICCIISTSSLFLRTVITSVVQYAHEKREFAVSPRLSLAVGPDPITEGLPCQ